jgi:hypothetical protein
LYDIRWAYHAKGYISSKGYYCTVILRFIKQGCISTKTTSQLQTTSNQQDYISFTRIHIIHKATDYSQGYTSATRLHLIHKAAPHLQGYTSSTRLHLIHKDTSHPSPTQGHISFSRQNINHKATNHSQGYISFKGYISFTRLNPPRDYILSTKSKRLHLAQMTSS